MKILDNVSMLLRQKGSNVFSLPSDALVYSAIEMMAGKRVGALLVIDDGKLVGVISERDYACKIILLGRSSKDTLVREIMTPSPITIRCDTSIEDAMRVMTDNGIGHLPVMDSAGRVAGVVSIGDLVKWIMTSQDEVISHLERYITQS